MYGLNWSGTGWNLFQPLTSRISRREPVFRGASMADVSSANRVLASKGEVPDLLDQVCSDHDSGSEPM